MLFPVLASMSQTDDEMGGTTHLPTGHSDMVAQTQRFLAQLSSAVQQLTSEVVV